MNICKLKTSLNSFALPAAAFSRLNENYVRRSVRICRTYSLIVSLIVRALFHKLFKIALRLFWGGLSD